MSSSLIQFFIKDFISISSATTGQFKAFNTHTHTMITFTALREKLQGNWLSGNDYKVTM